MASDVVAIPEERGIETHAIALVSRYKSLVIGSSASSDMSGPS